MTEGRRGVIDDGRGRPPRAPEPAAEAVEPAQKGASAETSPQPSADRSHDSASAAAAPEASETLGAASKAAADSAADDQRILRAALAAGEVHEFTRVVPDLTDLFKEVVK